ncbi:MAG: Si-specific NAD(P)(+) transhydrogenase [Acidobacteria bacterium]|nr:MAG: Si-specific NAD(P)(+) transhydrogenase [Acidobacteriota bacterium]
MMDSNGTKNGEIIYCEVAVVGSGPAGQRAAMECGREGRDTVIIDRRNLKVGGVSLHVGTIPSKTLREAVLHLIGYRHKHLYGDKYQVRQHICLKDLTERVELTLKRELAVLESQFMAAGVKVRYGEARFVDPHTVEIHNRMDKSRILLKADQFVLAPGTVPRHPEDIDFDYETIFDSNFVFSHKSHISELPKSLIVVGAGVIGTEYAAMFAALGCRVTLVDRHDHILPYLDGDIKRLLLSEMEKMGVSMVLGRGYRSIRRLENGKGMVETDTGKKLTADAVLVSLGRVPCVERLNLPAAGVDLGKRPVIKVDENFRTTAPHIFAAGDVIGPPALASTSAEQGRIAGRNVLGYTVRDHRPELFPFAIYSIPEASLIGSTEEQLVRKAIPFVKGVARYREVSKATIKGGSVGMLKLLFSPDDWKLLGIHVVGDQAAELIHIGQAVMSLGGRADYFVHNVFNYPTWAEAYRVAALDGLSRLNVPSHLDGNEMGGA